MEKKARIQIGKRVEERKRKQTITWKEWEKKEGRYPIIYVFFPRKFPSYTIMAEADDVFVRKTLTKETISALKQAGWDYRKETLFLVVDKEGYFIEWEHGGYEKREWGLRRKEKREEEELDIEF